MASKAMQRGPVRAAFSKTAKLLEDEFQKDEFNVVVLEQLFVRLEGHYKRLCELDNSILSDMIDYAEATQQDFDKEYSEVSKYVEKYSDLKVLYSNVLKKNKEASDSESETSSRRGEDKRTKLRLPKLDLQKFNGEPKDWLRFWSQFSSIHEDDTMTPSDKFQYLIQATVENSRARDVINSFPPSGENYPKVIKYLKERFGRDELLVEVYVRDMLRLVLENTGKQSKKIASLYDKLETQLRALSTLGVTQEKYAAMLYPLVESCLPEDTLRTWERQRHMNSNKDTSDLDNLMKFLRDEVEGEERIQLAKCGFVSEEKSTSDHHHKRKDRKEKESSTPTAVDLFSSSSNSQQCLFCNKSHSSSDCYTAARMNLETKKKIINEKKRCFTCLRAGHFTKNCKSKPVCQACGKKHLVLMCPDTPQNQVSMEVKTTKEGACASTVMNISNSSGTVLLQTLVVKIEGPKGYRNVRALIDTGSQRSYVTRKAVDAVGLQATENVMLTHALFGGFTTEEKNHSVYQVVVTGTVTEYKTTLIVLDQEKICGNIPRIQNGPWLEQLTRRGINFSDVGEDCPDIHILIGADQAGKLLTGRTVKTKNGLVAIQTELGWTVIGRTGQPGDVSTAMMITSLAVSDMDIQNLWRLDAIGINDPPETQNKVEEMKSAEIHFKKTVSINSEGRYEVRLPWLDCHPPVSNNYEVAVRRLQSATKKLTAEGQIKVYQSIFDAWESDGVVEKVSFGGSGLKGSYLPHRPVFKPTSLTTPVRPVFDASAKCRGEAAVNECLQKGSNLIELIPDIMTRFRMKKVGVISDIKKAFLQISICDEDRDYLRFLWWTEDNKIQEYRHRRVVFGITSSPFLLAMTLQHHLEQFRPEDEGIVQNLLKSLYIDNCVISFDSMEETKLFIEKSTSMLAKGKFDLRGWTWSGNNSEATEETVSVLGLLWNVKRDTLKLDMRSILSSVELASEESRVSSLGSSGCGLDSGRVGLMVTKRMILSAAHKIFDPIGVSSPVLIVPKKLLQEVWLQKIGWDDPVSKEVQKEFHKWKNELPALSEVEFPRWTMKDSKGIKESSLHVFSDASQGAYAGCIFHRVVYEDYSVTVQLVAARSRVAPTKKVTIPRLELIGCLIAARLASSTKEQMGLPDIESHYWTDSSNALYWIVKNENWNTFIWNRVEEIRKLSDITTWKHIPGDKNPADLPSRGCRAKALVASRWWEGPSWLYSTPEKWPISEVKADMEVVMKEKKRVVAVNSVTAGAAWYTGHFSSFRKLVRMIAWMRRWKSIPRSSSDVTVEEELAAELILWKLVQAQHYSEDSDLLRQLNAVRDAEGLWRVKTKLIMREDTQDFRMPILLPCKDEVVEVLIRNLHQKNSHCGVQVLLSMLREHYWIPKARQLVRKIIHSCGRCRRFSAKGVGVVEAPLPADRVKEAAVFEIVGVDLGGPLYLKEKVKAWFVVFTCGVYRAVHIELVTSLSTECFVQALRRFIARRGRPSVIRSDNGTNFEGTSNALSRVNWNEIAEYAKCEKIRWIFNPPSAPWWGGFWERIVGMIKKLLRRVLGRASLNYEEMLTVLLDCEEVINSRPLTYISEDVDDLIPLTPNMFLREVRSGVVTDLDQIERGALNKRFQYRQKLKDDLRRRFRSEYLGLLVHRMKTYPHSEVKVGDIVLIGSDNKKRQEWPLGRVEELFPGQDGINRVARVKTAQGEFTRPVQRLFLLEMTRDDVEIDDQHAPSAEDLVGDQHEPSAEEPAVVTRSGRRVKPVQRFGY